MNRSLLFLCVLFSSLLLYISCSSDKEEPTPDCSATTLVIEVVSVTDATCEDPGSVEVSSTGGEGMVTFSIDGTNFQESGSFGNLSPGNYTITAKDGQDCTVTQSVTVGSDSGGMTLSVENKSPSGCETDGGSVTLTASGGAGGYTFSQDGENFGDSNQFGGLESGQHTFSVRDSQGCVAVTTVTILTGVSLDAQVMPIINANCAISGCHLDTQTPMFTSKNVVISNAARIRTRTSNGSMPPAGQPDLSQTEIDLIACWVEDGALNN